MKIIFFYIKLFEQANANPLPANKTLSKVFTSYIYDEERVVCGLL